MSTDWQPTATLDALAARARLLAATRGFFAARNVMEVETPALVNAAVTDVNIASFAVPDGGGGLHLHTSPEYAMKRLLAAGAPDIYQLCKVFRRGERSALHNPEFTMVEWYRRGFSQQQLVEETAALVNHLLGARGPRPLESVGYREAFMATLGFDPVQAPQGTLVEAALDCGLAPGSARALERDQLLDLLVATRISPKLGHGSLCCLHGYPASQAALARLDPADPRLALRFELYAEGVELANGFVELSDGAEQRRRFEADRTLREQRGLGQPEVDQRFLAALAAGLPDCAGVALGFDRVLMLATGAKRIDEVIAFPVERA